MKWNRKQVAWSAFLVVLVLGMALVGSYRTFLGISAGHLEADARKSQHIDEQWSVVSAVDDHLAGLLFYDETKADFVLVFILIGRVCPLAMISFLVGAMARSCAA